MAVDRDKQAKSSKGPDEPMLRFKGRQWIVGANVLVMVALAVALMVFANYLAFNFNKKSDWTSSGVNSLSEETRKLMGGLEQSVTLTSLYQTFQDSAMDTEAKKFRTAVEDMLQLYQSESPSKVDIAFANPAKDRDKILALVDRLRKKTAYQGEAKKHKELIDKFTDELSAKIVQLMQAEGKAFGEMGEKHAALRDLREFPVIMRNYTVLGQQADRVKGNVKAMIGDDLPKFSTATDAVKQHYEQVKSALSGGSGWMASVDQWSKRFKVDLSEDAVKFFKGAPDRCKAVIDLIQAELDKTKDLPTLKIEELDRQVRTNTIIIETDQEAKALSFEDIWPAKQRGQYGQALGSKFEDRRNAAEPEISSALLQMTQKVKSAVVFVRFGGQPLFFGGMMMGGGQPIYGGAKERLEKANFIVKEWDLSTKKTPPEFDDKEKPDKIVWVLLKPEQAQPPRGMPPQMRQQPRMFGPQERQAVEKALGGEPRVMVIAGWVQPPRNPMMMRTPPTYEYNDWLKKQWGVEVQYNYPVMQANSLQPGQWVFNRDPFGITRFLFGDQAIVAPLKGLKGVFPMASPIKKEAKLPDGVTITDLVAIPGRDDIWGESDLQGLSQEYQKKHYTKKSKMDVSGPFPIAVAASRTKDDKPAGKMVLVSSRSFAIDQVALSRGLAQMGGGMVLVLNNPANLDVLVNSVHWLNDNEGRIGKGIESRDMPRLDIEPGVGTTVVKTLAAAVWPALALVAGLAVWFVRRR